MAQNSIKKPDDLIPSEIVKQLDKYIIGQDEAKRAMAIALRNRTRRRNVDEEMRDEIIPKNIIMIGPTGVGKTEVARRLARLTSAPFIKVEATKFTEVGYVGRDVESIIRDLATTAVNERQKQAMEIVKEEAAKRAEEQLLDILFPPPFRTKQQPNEPQNAISISSSLAVSHEKPQQQNEDPQKEQEARSSYEKSRSKMQKKLNQGDFDEKYIEIDAETPQMKNVFIDFVPEQGMEQLDQMMQSIMGSIGNLGSGRRKKSMRVKDARKFLIDRASEKLIDMDKVVTEAIEQTENMGIVFFDEIDKIASNEGATGADVSREGVQRDILPLVEGCTVNTRYGSIKTDHILFIASGAFHISKPSDLIPELQGRFPIRVELEPLSAEALEKILTEPQNSLMKQYIALMATEKVDLKFKPQAIREISRIAYDVNQNTFNIGARRLSTIMEKLLEDLLFDGSKAGTSVSIDKQYVTKKLKEIEEDQNLSKYIL